MKDSGPLVTERAGDSHIPYLNVLLVIPPGITAKRMLCSANRATIPLAMCPRAESTTSRFVVCVGIFMLLYVCRGALARRHRSSTPLLRRLSRSTTRHSDAVAGIKADAALGRECRTPGRRRDGNSIDDFPREPSDDVEDADSSSASTAHGSEIKAKDSDTVEAP